MTLKVASVQHGRVHVALPLVANAMKGMEMLRKGRTKRRYSSSDVRTAERDVETHKMGE